eukprot:1268400-Pleurochrysis_carterae.AAC.6
MRRAQAQAGVDELDLLRLRCGRIGSSLPSTSGEYCAECPCQRSAATALARQAAARVRAQAAGRGAPCGVLVQQLWRRSGIMSVEIRVRARDARCQIADHVQLHMRQFWCNNHVKSPVWDTKRQNNIHGTSPGENS